MAWLCGVYITTRTAKPGCTDWSRQVKKYEGVKPKKSKRCKVLLHTHVGIISTNIWFIRHWCQWLEAREECGIEHYQIFHKKEIISDQGWKTSSGERWRERGEGRGRDLITTNTSTSECGCTRRWKASLWGMPTTLVENSWTLFECQDQQRNTCDWCCNKPPA